MSACKLGLDTLWHQILVENEVEGQARTETQPVYLHRCIYYDLTVDILGFKQCRALLGQYFLEISHHMVHMKTYLFTPILVRIYFLIYLLIYIIFTIYTFIYLFICY